LDINVIQFTYIGTGFNAFGRFFLSKSKDLCGSSCSSYHFFTFNHLSNPIRSKDYPDRKEPK
tara:strand:- start:1871 stop:2056 length:186 start_codon:yes stop_codon:yes gene_type:complete